jgi:hypothetical protein
VFTARYDLGQSIKRSALVFIRVKELGTRFLLILGIMGPQRCAECKTYLERANTYRAEADEIKVWTSHANFHTTEYKEANAPESLHSAYISYLLITSLPLRQPLPRNLLPVYLQYLSSFSPQFTRLLPDPFSTIHPPLYEYLPALSVDGEIND